MVHVIDALDLRVALQDHRVEAVLLALLGEGGLQLRQRFERGLRPHVFVSVEDGQAVDVLHWHDGLREAALVPGLLGAALRFGGVGVEFIARVAPLGGDEVGGDALRHEVGFRRYLRVGRPGAAGGEHRHARHGFDAAADDEVGLAGHDLRRRLVAGLESRGAEAADGDAGGGLRIVGIQRGDAGDVGALLGDRLDAAEDDVVDQRSVERVAVAQGAQGSGGQLDRRHAVQRAVLAALAARRAHGIVDIGFGH